MPRMPQRLTLSGLMIAVVAFALSIKLGMAYSRSPRYWQEAEFYARASESASFLTNILESQDIPFQDSEPGVTSTSPSSIASKGVVMIVSPPRFNLHGADRQEAAKRSRSFADHLGRLRAKYRRAAFLPWLPNAPDLP